ncbi:MAG: hypothetical protein ACI9WC_001696 [Arenicella sp.]
MKLQIPIGKQCVTHKRSFDTSSNALLVTLLSFENTRAIDDYVFCQFQEKQEKTPARNNLTEVVDDITIQKISYLSQNDLFVDTFYWFYFVKLNSAK